MLTTYEIFEALSEADPDHAATYETNGYALIDRLDGLLAEIDAELAPVRDKPFIVLHDAYSVLRGTLRPERRRLDYRQPGAGAGGAADRRDSRQGE